MKIALIAFLFLLISGCQKSIPHSDDEINDSIQERRSKIIGEFFRDPDSSIKTYKSSLRKNLLSTEKRQISENLAAISQLISRDKANRNEYFLYINKHLNDKDVETQSLAIAALSGDDKTETLNILFEKLRDGPELVKIEALSALKYRYDSIYADKSQRETIDSARNEAASFCNQEDLSASTFSLQFCDYFKNRDS